MSQIGNTEALDAYLKLQKENERLQDEIRNWKYKYEEYHKAWGKASEGINHLFNWLETRENTKTETIRRKMAETFKYAYMEAQFEDMKAKWPCNQKVALENSSSKPQNHSNEEIGGVKA
jgi:hypothetical protein